MFPETCIQEKCKVIVKKLHRMRAMRDMERCFFFRNSLCMTLPEPQRSEDPTPEKYISIQNQNQQFISPQGLVASWTD